MAARTAVLLRLRRSVVLALAAHRVYPYPARHGPVVVTVAGSDECARCFRSRDDHEHQADGTADDVKRRIWRALGQPCAAFADTLGSIYAANQAARARRPGPARPSRAAPDPRQAATAARGAALARQMLTAGSRQQ